MKDRFEVIRHSRDLILIKDNVKQEYKAKSFIEIQKKYGDLENFKEKINGFNRASGVLYEVF